MSYEVFDRVKQALTSTGTGNLTLGPALAGFQTYAEAGAADGANVVYVLEDAGGFEISWGQLGGGGTILSRNVISSSNAGLPLDLTGDAVIFSALTKSEFDLKLTAGPGAGSWSTFAEYKTDHGFSVHSATNGGRAFFSVTGGVGWVGAENTTSSLWCGFGGALNANNRFNLYGSNAFEFSVTPYVGTVAVSLANHTHSYQFSDLTSHPTTLAGYGITDAVAASQKGVANGVVPLGADTKIAATYLPSFVDDVLEFSSLASFPGTGETGKIYVAIDTGWEYRWSGSLYTRIVASPGSTDAVPEGSVNLYFTNTRAQAALAGPLGLKLDSSAFTFANLGGKPITLLGYGITDAVSDSEKGVANGVATLDANGDLEASQIPSDLLGSRWTTVVLIADQAVSAATTDWTEIQVGIPPSAFEANGLYEFELHVLVGHATNQYLNATLNVPDNCSGTAVLEGHRATATPLFGQGPAPFSGIGVAFGVGLQGQGVTSPNTIVARGIVKVGATAPSTAGLRFYINMNTTATYYARAGSFFKARKLN